MRVAILYAPAVSPPDTPPDARGVLETVEAVYTAVSDLGHAPLRVQLGASLEGWIGRLREADVDMVFNLCEGAADTPADEARITAVLELLGLPMTGSPSYVLALARRKDHVNAILAAAGLPVPAWTLAAPHGRPPPWTHFPAIVKPATENASGGIAQRSVARDPDELADAIARAGQYGPTIVQGFVSGRELRVGIVGDRVLPVAEIELTRIADGARPIITDIAEWHTGPTEDLVSAPHSVTDLDASTHDQAIGLALAAWQQIGGRGYGRVDLRADHDGKLHVLEVNPNPDLSPSAELTRMAAAHGWGYVDLIDRILREAAP